MVLQRLDCLHRIALVEREEDAEMVAEILSEVIDVTLATVQHSYIIEESYPYSVQWAKQHMLQTLEVGQNKPDKTCSTMIFCDYSVTSYRMILENLCLQQMNGRKMMVGCLAMLGLSLLLLLVSQSRLLLLLTPGLVVWCLIVYSHRLNPILLAL